jgi:two-component system nitrogen regulation response regulator NtrX
MALDLLIVDDEADIRDLIAGVLGDEGYGSRTAGDSDGALAALAERRPSLIILDVWLQGSRLDGIELLDELKRRDPTLPVVVISGHGNIETAVAAIKRGAYDFIEKPFKADRLVLVADRALEASRLKREIVDLKSRSSARRPVRVVDWARRCPVIQAVAPASARASGSTLRIPQHARRSSIES